MHWRAPTNRSKSPSRDTSNRAATSTGSTAYSHTCAASQHWKLICAYSCARAVADHGCGQQTSALFFYVRPNCHCKPPPTSCHATLSGACRLRGDRHLLALLQDEQTEAKATGCFSAVRDIYGTTMVMLGQDYRIRVSWWVVDVYLQYCSEGFLVVACCEPHASSVILLMRGCCATS